MDIECKEGRHWTDIILMKSCSQNKGGCDQCVLPINNKQPLSSKEHLYTNSIPTSKPQFIFPPSIPYPKKPQYDKPFWGAYKDKELKFYFDRYCTQCHKEVIGHMQQFGIAIMIDAYWCPNCKVALWESQTFIYK